jgi:glucose-6-phosphate 1-dehydrogenase
VAPTSTVETFAAVRLFIDSWRWGGVPFYLRAGKSLPVTCTEVVIEFDRPPQRLFATRELVPAHNHVRIRLSPEEVIAISARAKKPGPRMDGRDVELTVMSNPAGDLEPYERLLGSAMEGDSSLFARQDTVEAAWRVVDPILGNVTPVEEYAPGTWGPASAGRLLPDGETWHDPVAAGGAG